jgi:hypothetical protein
MAEVYTNGCVNIAATSAANGSEGLFFTRPANWRYQIRLRDKSGTKIEPFDCEFRGWDSALSLAMHDPLH